MFSESKIDAYKSKFARVECALKDYEISTAQGLILPALNEIRYSTQHLLIYLGSANEEEGEANYKKADNHLDRALYDVYDAQILFLIDKFEEFKKDYKLVQIQSIIPDYNAQRIAVNKVMSSISKASREDREKFVKTKGEQLEKSREIYEIWTAAREELNKLKIANRVKIITNIVIPVIASVISAVIGAVIVKFL